MPKLIAGKPEEVKPVEYPTHVWCHQAGDAVLIRASNPGVENGAHFYIGKIDSRGLCLNLALPESLGIAVDVDGRVKRLN